MEVYIWSGQSRRLASLVVCATWFVICIGCGSNYPETAEVRGRVRYAGKPVAQGRILFWPTNGRPAMAELDEDGTYSLTTFDSQDGALLGEHRVTIKATRVHFQDKGVPAKAVSVDPISDSSRAIVEWLVPQSYEILETSPLRAKVERGKNTIDFDLPAESQL